MTGLSYCGVAGIQNPAGWLSPVNCQVFQHPPVCACETIVFCSMAQFNQQKAYAEQEDVFFDDGREVELLHFVYGKSNIDEIRGSPEKVLAAIDEFGRTKKYLMNVGEDKGKIVTDLIAEVKPKTMVVASSRYWPTRLMKR